MVYRSSPNPAALFWLIPDNKEAETVAKDPANRRRVAHMENRDLAFDIGLHIRQYSQTTLVTLGRHGDISIPDINIRRLHCSFEIDDLTTGIVRLWDYTKGDTRVIGNGSFPFRTASERKVVFWPKCNTRFEIGPNKKQQYRFRLLWIKKSDAEIVETIRPYLDPAIAAMEDLCDARTVVDDGDKTTDPSHLPSKIHTVGQAKLRYFQQEFLGSGSFGEVHRAINVDTGRLVAVKRQQRPNNGWLQHVWNQLLNEVNIMNNISHVNIINMIMSQGFDEPVFEIFRDGNITNLFGPSLDRPGEFSSLLRQMLAALDCLAYQGILHRDVKPQNILYRTLPQGDEMGCYHFQLADFDLSKMVGYARSRQGTDIYMSPEISANDGREQTPKVDVWSLFVTFAMTFNVCDFRNRAQTGWRILDAIEDARKSSKLAKLRHMATENPCHRILAAQMIIEHFDGFRLLSTPRHEVPRFFPAEILDDPMEVDQQETVKAEEAKDTETKDHAVQSGRRDKPMPDIGGVTESEIRHARLQGRKSKTTARRGSRKGVYKYRASARKGR